MCEQESYRPTTIAHNTSRNMAEKKKKTGERKKTETHESEKGTQQAVAYTHTQESKTEFKSAMSGYEIKL